jgi:hypothetical protein
MPSLEHEELVELFRRDPELAVQLARGVGVAIPPYSSFRVGPADLTELVPTSYRADVLILLQNGAPVFVLIVEVQLDRDEDKLFSWPFYATTARAKHRCPCCVLVYTVTPEIARWASKPIDIGQPGSEFRPMVVGPKNVPEIVDPAQAKATPYLALLSALAHGHGEHAEQIALTALEGLESFSEDERVVWTQLLYAGINEAARRALEAKLNLANLKEQFPFFIEGQRKGELKGKAEGELHGERKGKADSILAVLASRSLSLTESQRVLVRECKNLEQLDQWLIRAVTAASADEVFLAAGPPQSSAQ